VTFSPEWDQAYRANTHNTLWPWSDLVSYVHRYAKPANGFCRVLELGCGVGANVPLFVSLGVDYFGVEGSAAAVARLHEAYPQLRQKIVVGDFTQTIFFDGPFDLIVDRAATPHNTTDAVRRTLAMVFNRLRTGGKFIGIDWFSTSHKDAGHGDALDSRTRTNIPNGQFAGIGAVHFTDRHHLVDLLTSAGFHVERLEHKQIDVVVPADNSRLGWWNFVARKP
jgi:SAM-dependent methyltransferase